MRGPGVTVTLISKTIAWTTITITGLTETITPWIIVIPITFLLSPFTYFQGNKKGALTTPTFACSIIIINIFKIVYILIVDKIDYEALYDIIYKYDYILVNNIDSKYNNPC